MKKKTILTIVAVVLLLCGVGLLFLAVKLYRDSHKETNGTGGIKGNVTDNRIQVDGAWYEPKDNIRTLLFIGVDEAEELNETEGYRNNGQSDVLVLCVFDLDNKSYQALQINRDTVSEIPIIDVLGQDAGQFSGQLALAYTYGSGMEDSGRNTVKAVSQFLGGVKIDDYAALSINGIQVLNDAVGGVTVTIEDDFSAVDEAFVMGETITLHGKQAETFVRSRGQMGEPTNINRMSRQCTYMNAWLSQAHGAWETDTDFIATTVLQLSGYLVSNLSVYGMSDYADMAFQYTNGGILQMEGETAVVNGFMEFYPDKEKLQKQVVELFYQPME